MGGIYDIRNLITPVKPVSEIQKTGKEQENINPGQFEMLLRAAQESQQSFENFVEEKVEEKKEPVDNTNQQMQVSLQASFGLMNQLLARAEKPKEKK